MKFIVEYAERGGEMPDGRVAGCAVGQETPRQRGATGRTRSERAR